MAAHLIEPEDIIKVDFVPLLLFGPPGSWKTSIAQTAHNPCTLDFDKGIHRSFNRKRAFRFDSWADCIKAGEDGLFDPYATIVIDTGGRALDSMIPGILAESYSNSVKGGGALSISGWGVLGVRFNTWLKTVRGWGKDVVMICHQEDSKDANGKTDSAPDLTGKMAWKEIHKSFDLIGQIVYDGRRRFLDFSPCEGSLCRKNAANWDAIAIPDLASNPTFLADLIADAKARIGRTAAASAAVAAEVREWQKWLAAEPTLEPFNKRVATEFPKLKSPAREQVWVLIMQYALEQDWLLDRKARMFYQPETIEEAAAVAPASNGALKEDEF